MHACSLFKEKEILLYSFTTGVEREPQTLGRDLFTLDKHFIGKVYMPIVFPALGKDF